MPTDDLSIGEIGRIVTKVEAKIDVLSSQMLGTIGPIAVMKDKLERAEKDINEVHQNNRVLAERLAALSESTQKDLASVRVKAGWFSGYIAAAGLLGTIIFELVRH
jgi:hypothetical protein